MQLPQLRELRLTLCEGIEGVLTGSLYCVYFLQNSRCIPRGLSLSVHGNAGLHSCALWSS